MLILIIILAVFIVSALFWLIKGGKLDLYLTILSGMILFFIIVTVYLLVMLMLTVRITKNKRLPGFLIPVFEYSIKAVYPIMISFCDLFKIEKDAIRRFFSEINNRVVIQKNKKLNPEDILMIAPHCLQKASCKHKITGDINNCKRCGGCDINGLFDLCTSYNINLQIVTGGTLARKIIKDYRPKGVIAIACERDLSHGILDVKGIPVIGVKNERPNGPCYNTCVDIDKVEKAIKQFLRRE
jgi:hypothetical protein